MKKAKGKGIAAAPDFFPVPQDPGIRFRHLGLLQDYRDLLKETDATRKKMEILQQRKLSLLTEVQYDYYEKSAFVQQPHELIPKVGLPANYFSYCVTMSLVEEAMFFVAPSASDIVMNLLTQGVVAA